MGINIPTRGELIANQKPLEELAAYFGADSLAYLSLPGLKGAVQQNAKSDDPDGPAHCTGSLGCDVLSACI
jgi:amidophosphoribosyltransferase